MRVIGMLLGIPEQDQVAVRDRVDAMLRTEAGKPMEVSENFANGEHFAEYVDWRAHHPSDDIMTELLNVEFEDETGTVRRLTRGELLTYVNVVAGAGNETTMRLIGWAGKVLADHPDQRMELVEDPSLIPNAIEELLRYEPPAPHVGRYVARDVQLHGHVVPAGSAMLCLVGAATHDDRRHPTATDSTSTGRSGSTSRSGTAFTTALAPRWRGSRAASRWKRCSSGSPNGSSTGSTQSWPRRPPCGAGRPSRSSRHEP